MLIILIILFCLILILIILKAKVTGAGTEKHFLMLRHSERLDEATNWKASESQKEYDTPITSNLFFFNKFYNYFCKIIPQFNKIYCSPFTRCIETAMLINKKLKTVLPICLEPGLIEISSLSFYLDNSYFSNPEIYKRFGAKYFDTAYVPVISENKLRKYLKSEYTYETVKSKLKSVLKKIDSGIIVSHREVISVTESKNDDYCGASYVKFTGNNEIILIDSY